MSIQNASIETIFRSILNLNDDSTYMNMTQSDIESRTREITRQIMEVASSNRARAHLRIQRDAIMALNLLASQRTFNGPYTAPLRTANQPATQRKNPLEKTKIVCQTKLDELCPDYCAICQEKPKIKDAVCTECNHYYCKTCWNDWMNSATGNKKCPTCRKDMPRVTSFKARVNKKLTGPMTAPIRQTLIIEDDEP